jgi:CRISPR/Cas system-associated exonuclease Cas4 (RecB family)
MKRVVTYTELRTWQRCAYKGHLVYDLLLSPKVKSPGLREGSIWDKGMDALYGHFAEHGEYSLAVMQAAIIEQAHEESNRILAAGADLAPEVWAEMQERVDLLLDVARLYVAYAREHDDFIPVLTQYEGRVPIINPASGRASTKWDFAYKPDGIALADGELWLLENKCWKGWDQSALRYLPRDEQTLMYLWALNIDLQRNLHRMPKRLQQSVHMSGGRVAGIIYNVVRKAVPRVPALLKDGSTSKDKRIDTDYDTYYSTLLERGQNPADYTEILDVLKEKGDTFHHRERIHYNADQLAEVGARVHELTRFRLSGFQMKHRQRDCSWDCPYQPLCDEWDDDLAEVHYLVRAQAHPEYTEDIAA